MIIWRIELEIPTYSFQWRARVYNKCNLVPRVLSLNSRKNPGAAGHVVIKIWEPKETGGGKKSKQLTLWQKLLCQGPRGLCHLVYYQLII